MILPSRLLAAATLLVGASAPFPSIDVAKLCAHASLAVDSDRAASSCRRQETEARDGLRALWAKLSDPERTVCVGDPEIVAARSYSDILGCVETSRHLQRLKGRTAPR